MQVFQMEVRFHIKELIFWSLGMAALVGASFAKYQAFSSSGDQTSLLMSELPPMVQAFFGMTGLDVMTVSGFYGVMFLYLALMASVHAGLLGESLFAREEREGTAGFLYARPCSRSRIATEKLLAGVVNVLILNAVTAVASLLAVSGLSVEPDIACEIGVLMSAMLIMQFAFLSLGSLLATALKNPKAAAPLVGAIVLASYLGYVLCKLMPSISWLRSCSIFALFDAAKIVPGQALDALPVAGCLIFILACFAATYVFHARRDFLN